MYTKREAAAALGIDRNTLDKWLKVCGIIPKRDPRDTRLRLLSDDDVLRLREHYAESHRAFNGASVHLSVSSADLEARIAALEQRVADLEQRAILRSATNLPPPVSSTVYPPPRRQIVATVSHTRTPARPPVPPHLMSLPTWADRHGVNVSRAKTWREKRYLPVERGQWLEPGRGRIDTALDEAGRRIAHQLAGIPWPCEVCAAAADEETEETAERELPATSLAVVAGSYEVDDEGS